MSIKVHLTGELGNYTQRNVDIEIPQAEDVMDLLGRLFSIYPPIRSRILDDQDKTRPYVNIFVNADSIRDLQGERTKVKDGDEVYVLPSVAGG